MTSQRLPVPLSLQHTHQNNLRNYFLFLSSFELLFVSQPDLYLKVRHTTSLLFLQRVCHGRHFFARAACFLRLLRAIFQIDLLLTWAFAACVREETPWNLGPISAFYAGILCRVHAAHSHLVRTTPNMRGWQSMSIATHTHFPIPNITGCPRFLHADANTYIDKYWTKTDTNTDRCTDTDTDVYRYRYRLKYSMHPTFPFQIQLVLPDLRVPDKNKDCGWSWFRAVHTICISSWRCW